MERGSAVSHSEDELAQLKELQLAQRESSDVLLWKDCWCSREQQTGQQSEAHSVDCFALMVLLAQQWMKGECLDNKKRPRCWAK